MWQQSLYIDTHTGRPDHFVVGVREVGDHLSQFCVFLPFDNKDSHYRKGSVLRRVDKMNLQRKTLALQQKTLAGVMVGAGTQISGFLAAIQYAIGLVTLNAEDDPFDIKDRPRMFEVA